jgi:hypothetical protein
MTNRRITFGAVLAAVIVLGVGGALVLGQQVLRQSANHPQVEIARAAVSRLDAGEKPNAVLPANPVDIGRSADPYLIVVDTQGTLLASSASLNGEVVLPPSGVFDYVRAHGEDRITWQPAPYVRSAIVVDAYKGGFVVAGRSLSDTERTVDLLTFWGALAALGLAGVGALALILLR